MCDTKYRGPKDRSTQKSGPSGLDFWVRLAFGQAQNKNQSWPRTACWPRLSHDRPKAYHALTRCLRQLETNPMWMRAHEGVVKVNLHSKFTYYLFKSKRKGAASSPPTSYIYPIRCSLIWMSLLSLKWLIKCKAMMGICIYWSCRHVIFVKRCNYLFNLTVGNLLQSLT